MKISRKTLRQIGILLILLPIIAIVNFSEAASYEKIKPKIIFGDDINYPPYSFLDPSGKPAGYNVELAKAVGEAMGYDVEIQLGEWSQVRADLESGKINAISGMFFSKERDKVVDFTIKHSITNGDIFTNQSSRISSVDALKGKKVAVQKGDIVAEYLESLDIGIQLIEVQTVNEALRLVEEGKYDYAGLMKLPGLYGIKENNLKNVHAEDLNLIPNDYCMAVKEGNNTLLLTLNGGLKILKETGEYEKIYDRWLNVYEVKTPWTLVLKYRWFILLAITIVTILILSNFLLNRLIQIKTKELRLSNEALNSEHKRLAASEERNKAIVNALPDLVFTFNKEGRFLDCQAANEEQLLVPKAVFIGQLLEAIMPEEIANLGYDRIAKAFETNELQRLEYGLEINGQMEFFEMRIVVSKENEVIGITRNISTDKQYREQIEYLSYHDQLTGLYNRRFFEEELKRLDNKRNLPLGIVMADVNGLKLVNDSFGHLIGDQLLIKVAEVLKKTCRADEIISRIGGDEFTILIPRIEENQIEALISRIQEAAAQEKIGSVELSVSFGWDIKENNQEDILEIFKKAENYMYQKKLFEGPSMRGKTIGAILTTLNEKNSREKRHSQRVSELCERFAVALGFSERGIEEMKTAGLLHDIGKIAINEELLNRAGPLSAEEMEEVRRHPEIGYRILRSVNDMVEMSEYVLCHHERWDGTGYPKGLKREEVPIQARILSIADAFDAITSERSYRRTKTDQEGAQELLKCAGTQFDPSLIPTFVKMILSETDTAGSE